MHEFEKLDASKKFTRCYSADAKPEILAVCKEMESSIPKFIKILEQFGDLLPEAMMLGFYAGFGFLLKITKKPIYLRIGYANNLIQIDAKIIKKYTSIEDWWAISYEDAYYLKEYGDCLTIDKLQHELSTFVNLF